MLRLACRQLLPDSGEVWLRPGARLAVLEQDIVSVADSTVGEVVTAGLRAGVPGLEDWEIPSRVATVLSQLSLDDSARLRHRLWVMRMAAEQLERVRDGRQRISQLVRQYREELFLASKQGTQLVFGATTIIELFRPCDRAMHQHDMRRTCDLACRGVHLEPVFFAAFLARVFERDLVGVPA